MTDPDAAVKIDRNVLGSSVIYLEKLSEMLKDRGIYPISATTVVRLWAEGDPDGAIHHLFTIEENRRK